MQGVPIKPDDTWCWLICLGNMVTAFTTIGMYRCFGVFYPAIMDEFEAQYAQVSLISGLFTGSMAIGGLLLFLARKYGCRIIGMASSLGFSLSLFASSISSSIEMLIVLCGVAGGFFCGILTNVFYISSALYFTKHRSKASGIAMAGIPLGTFVAPALDALIDYYSWRGAMMIVSAVSMHACAASALYRPLSREIVESEHDNTILSKGKTNNSSEKKWQTLSYLLNYKIFLRPACVLMFISSVTYWTANSGGVFLLVPFGMEAIKVSRKKASILLTFQSAGELIGKLICGPIGDHGKTNRSILLVVTTFLNGTAYLGITFCETYLSANVLAFLQGLICAFYAGLSVVLYADVFGLENLTSAISYEAFFTSAFTLPVVYLLGIGIDTTGDVEIPYYVCAILMVLCSASIFGVFLVNKREIRRKDPEKVVDD